MDKKNNEFISLSVKLMVIVAVVVLLLAVANELTEDKITQLSAEASSKARQELIADATLFEDITAEISLSETEAKTISKVYRAGDGTETGILGYCVDVTVSGFGGDIDLIVAISSDGRVYGLKTINHTETAGIGSDALDPEDELIPRYEGVVFSEIEGIEAKSGATVTSVAVKTGVQSAVSIVSRIIGEGGNS